MLLESVSHPLVPVIPRPQYLSLALRKNLTGSQPDGISVRAFFGYTRQFERQRLDEDPGLAGLQGLSERDQRTSQDPETVGAA